MRHRLAALVTRACSIAVVVLAAAIPPADALAQSTTTVPASTVDQALFTEQWKAVFTGSTRLEKFALLDYLQDIYRRDPSRSTNDAVYELVELRKDYDAHVNKGQLSNYEPTKKTVEFITSLFDVAGATGHPATGVVASSSKIILKHFVDQGYEKLDLANQFNSLRFQSEIADRMRVQESQVLDDAVRLARENPGFASAFDVYFGTDLGVSIKNFSAKEIIDKSKVKVPDRIRNSLRPDGSLSISLTELRQEVREQFNKINSQLDATREQLKTIDQQQKELLKYAQDEEKRRAEEKRVADAAALRQLELNAASSAIGILSTLLGFVDRDLGRHVSVVGGAMLQVAQSFNDFAQTAATLGSIGSALGSVVLTGNVLGAAMNLISLLQPAEPSPEQLIMEQIGKLSQQLRTVQREMHDRFDRIDRSLNEILSTVSTTLQRMETNFEEVRKDLRAIQETLLEVQAQLGRLELGITQLLDAGFRRELKEAFNGAIGFRERTGVEMDYQAQYIDYENKFYTWAVDHAFDPLATGGANDSRSFDPAHVSSELAKGSDYSNLNYLTEWLRRYAPGVPSLSQQPLPNAQDWSVAARAYALLQSEWPRHAARVSSARSDAIYAIGQQLEETLRRIAVSRNEQGAAIGNHQLFDFLVTNYKEKAAALLDSLQRAEERFVARLAEESPEERLTGQPAPEPGLKLWDGAGQRLNFRPRLSPNPSAGNDRNTISPCQGGSQLPAPDRVRDMVDPPFMLATYLRGTNPSTGGLDMQACYSASWVERETRPIPRSDAETLWAKPRVEIRLRINGVTIAKYAVVGGFRHIGEVGGAVPIPERRVSEFVAANWTDGAQLRNLFTGGTVVALSDVERQDRDKLASEVTADVDRRLSELHRRLYAEIQQDLAGSSILRPGLQRDLDSLAGAKRALLALINLGLPRAFEDDEYLRSFFSGRQGLLDHNVLYVYNVAGRGALQAVRPDGSPEADELPEQWRQTAGNRANVRDGIKLAIDQRVPAVAEVIRKYLDQTARGERVEQHALVKTTLLMLRLAEVAPLAPRDSRFFAATSFRIDHDPFWAYFNAMGGTRTFGYPVSRTAQLLGCTTQIFQRQLFQQCEGGNVQTMNLLDPELMPYDQINRSRFPAHDPAVASRAPSPGTANYGRAVLDYVRTTAPDSFEGLPVRFYGTFVGTVPGADPARDPAQAALVNLQVWGFPTSRPAFDPSNRNFVYQRFQRGIMHYDATTGATQGILLADYFKSVIAGRNYPSDLAEQARNSRFMSQYCPFVPPTAVCNRDRLPATALRFFFEPQ